MVVVVVMGVCGSGKTTVGEALAKKFEWQFRDADDFHSEANRQKMASGVPLTDEDRVPWLLSIHDCVARRDTDQSMVVTCSALKRWYRDVLRSGQSAARHPEFSAPSSSTSPPPSQASIPPSSAAPPSDILFVLLAGSRPVLESRLAGRKGHFMNPELLTSQLAILEEPGPDENAIVLNIDDTVANLVDTIAEKVKTR